MCRGLVGRNPRGRRLSLNLLIAFVPSAALGLLLHDWIDDNLFSMGAVIFGLIAGSLLMFVADGWARWLEQRQVYQGEFTPAGAAIIGFFQCLAMWPGTSRPMMTIVGGYLAGLPPGPAAGFSFLLGFVTLSAATIYKAMKRPAHNRNLWLAKRHFGDGGGSHYRLDFRPFLHQTTSAGPGSLCLVSPRSGRVLLMS
jgi:undecaprenyl-diphosphatase